MDLLAVFTAIEERFRVLIREEIQRALASQKPEPLLLDTNQAAALLNVKPSKVATMARNGKLPKVKNLGHSVRFRRHDIEQLCTQNSGPASGAEAQRNGRKSSAAGAETGSLADFTR